MNNSTNLPAIQMPDGIKAVLVWKDRDGTVRTQDVPHDSSVLNINRDLRDHLDDYPHSNEWLIQLRDYLNGRIAAQAEARKHGGFVIPTHGDATWSSSGWATVKS